LRLYHPIHFFTTPSNPEYLAVEMPERVKEEESWPMRSRVNRDNRVSVLEWGRGKQGEVQRGDIGMSCPAKKKAYLGEVGFSCFSSQTGGCPA